MAIFTVRVGFYFLSFISSIIQTFAMSIIGLNEIEDGNNCTYTPHYYNIPCKQYLMNTRTQCTQKWLSTQYQNLYEATEPGMAYLPGTIQDIDARPDVVSWRAPEDGSIHFLKGFYVELKGHSFQNFGMTLCTIIDLSDSSQETIQLLTNTTFHLNVTVAGDFLVNIEPLPPRPTSDKEEKPITKPSIPLEYHPKFREQRIEYGQINGSCINITVILEPEIEYVEQLYMEVLDSLGKAEETLFQNLIYPKPFYIIDGFRQGNYSLWIRPIDPFSADSTRCVCYNKGVEAQRYCVACREIGIFVQITDIEETTSKPSSTTTDGFELFIDTIG